MLKGLSGILEKSKSLKLPGLSQTVPTQTKDVSEPNAVAAPAPVQSPATTSVAGDKDQEQAWTEAEIKIKAIATKYRAAYAGLAATEAIGNALSVENGDLVIAAAYKQVFGNAHLMESERCVKAESQVRSGDITVLEFIRQLAKSDHYRSLFWEKHPNVTAIELNFKHLLGRPPESYAEISEHIQIIAAGGFEAEIDSYLDSDEYLQTFGTMFVPYLRGYDTQIGRNSVGFSRSFSLFGTACGSDKSRFGGDAPGLKPNLLADAPGGLPALRDIPNYSAEELVARGIMSAPRAPRVPKELYAIARGLLAEMAERKGSPIANY
ncbi:phycobilisome rod-core linker polypeptide [Leptothoe sp. PORK10 BA2]|uniref:phycobilisome rod-core linker polypeptide n=1 Tax=Leptothoe sp. PORK10 BA2 TaxID=3110254 RepID=UPI002B22090A|nr:phycobilisome rod-core linker polypeptide [Leptothoe sp. PORK10 BA2]MEA5462588.1 phycobilisome rod-core linker polypeptide [Leptothoe sp. PORK10 BA2]